jgi:hypothetical protein
MRPILRNTVFSKHFSSWLDPCSECRKAERVSSARAPDGEARDAGLDGIRGGNRAGLAHQDVVALALPLLARGLIFMATNDRDASVRRSFGLSSERERGARAIGCPRCGSTCGFLDDCAVCLGEVICARCLFGVRVDADEIHAAFVLEG